MENCKKQTKEKIYDKIPQKYQTRLMERIKYYFCCQTKTTLNAPEVR